ncbi:MAG TPA: dihydrolipoamide acetyltransferase family protein [Solirubrobacteraceae bacterium]|jgi:pyruvate dehydrogenase E2 component (dihydrolipoamide acetyltransferase)
MAEIVMPRLSDTMEEGTILRWLKRSGERVSRGEELVEIETDKAAMIYESDEDGVLEIAVDEGETLPVGATIAHIGAATGPNEQAAADPAAPTQVAPQPDRAAPQPSAGTPQPDTANPPPRVKASPVARRVARERKVDLDRMTGSGPGGRIVKADVEAAAAGKAPAGHGSAISDGGVPTSEPPPPLAERVATAKGETTIVELTRTQQTIARRMAESKATVPDFSLRVEIDMDACVALRGELKRLSPEQAPTYNDMVVKACALALREHPHANGSYRDGKLQLHSRVNVGVAVATDDALVVPTVFDTDVKALGEIARETRALAERVRAGTITPPELGGGTFTVSNLGMYGVSHFTAIINPPQAAILSVGSLAPRAVVWEGQIVARHTMAVTLVCDHRILYGAGAARFLARVRELLKEPAALTL